MPVRCQRCKGNARAAVLHAVLTWGEETWEIDLCRTHAITLRRMLDGWVGRPMDDSIAAQLQLRTTVPASTVAPLRR